MPAAEPLPPPVRRLPVSELPSIQLHHAHQFPGPMCLAGGEQPSSGAFYCPRLRRCLRRSPSRRPQCFLWPSLHWYQQKQDKRHATGELVKRYTKQRSSNTYTCRKCGEIRLPPDHTQYYGSWFCLRTSAVSLEEWRRRKEKKEKREEEEVTILCKLKLTIIVLLTFYLT